MKILNIIQCANLGGMEKSTLESLTELKKAGHEVLMLSLHPVGGLGSLAEQRGITLKGKAGYRIWGMSLVPWLVSEIRQYNPDRILLTGHNFGSLTASVISRRRTYLSIHFHHGDRPILLWKAFYWAAKKSCKGIRFISQFIYEEVQELFAGYENVYTFINIFRAQKILISREEARMKLNLSMDDFVIGNAGWLIPRKAFDVFLEVAAEVKKEIPRAVFLIAGDGKERDRLQDQARHLGISNSVHFLGWQKNLQPFYKAIDILLFNSRFDAVGRTPIEALTLGVPVVASVEQGGLKEFLRNGIDGVLLNKHNIKTLADEIIRLYNNPQMREELAKSGKKHLLDVGSPELHAKRLSKFLDLEQNKPLN